MDIKNTEVHFKIHDAYVAFSSEIVRIALLSPLVFPFFMAFAGKDPNAKAVAAVFAPAHFSLSLGLIFMAVAVCFGLVHRYFAVDFMSDYIERERKKAQLSVLPTTNNQNTTNAITEKIAELDESCRTDLEICTFAIKAAPICLLFGAGFLFYAVSQILTGS